MFPTIANFKIISTYSDDQLSAYFQGFATALGNNNVSQEDRDVALQEVKAAIASYNSKSQSEKDEIDASIITPAGL